MRRPLPARPVAATPGLPRWLGPGVVGVALVAHAALLRAELGGGRTDALSSGALLAAGLPGLLATALVGRIVLSLLPPGPPGAHDPRGLPATWAASHLLGALAIGALGLVAGSPGAAHPFAACVLPWLVVGLVRTLLLPGAQVPRHDERLRALEVGPPRALNVLVLVAAAGALLLPVLGAATGLGPEGGAEIPGSSRLLLAWLGVLVRIPPGEAESAARLAPAVTWSATVLVVAGALATARRDVLARRAWVVAAALVPAPVALACAGDGALLAAGLAALALAGGVAWLRRADRRGRALALLGLGGLWLAGEAWLAVVGALLLALLTAPASRRAVALHALLACGAAAGVAALGDVPLAPGAGARLGELPARTVALSWELLDPRRFGLVFALVPLAAVAALLRARRAGTAPRGPDEVEDPRGEHALPAGVLVAGALVLVLAGRAPGLAGLLLLPAALLVVGLALPPAASLAPPRPLS